MSDIVQRLRDHKNYSPLHHEAADEIERLREHVNALRLVATSHEPEIERLRLLVEIAAGALEPEP